METIVTSFKFVYSVGAFIVLQTVSGIWMLEKAILADTLLIRTRRLGRLLNFIFRAFYNVGVVALINAGS